MPLTHIPPGRLRRIVVPALVVLALVILPFLLLEGTHEMVCLQLAGTEKDAEEIIAGWSHADIRDIAFLQGVDELLPLTYGPLLAAATVWSGRQQRGRGSHWAPAIAWMAPAAGGFDLLENLGMILMIRGSIDTPVPTITTTLAVAKYLLLIIVLSYVAVGAVGRLRGARISAVA